MASQLLQKLEIGYFVSTTVDNFVFVGGLMVTDQYGLPLEFRYTEPVRANRLQRVLYGDVLERFIHTDVILANLMERIEQKTAFLVVNDDSFLAASSKNGTVGVCLSETRVPKLSAVGELQITSPDEFLVQVSEAGSPVRVRMSPSACAEESRASAGELFSELSKTMDIFEPLKRTESAIKLLWEESPENPLKPIPVPRRNAA